MYLIKEEVHIWQDNGKTSVYTDTVKNNQMGNSDLGHAFFSIFNP